MADGSAGVHLAGAEQLARGLDEAQRETNRAMAKAYRDTAKVVRDWARAAAASGTPLQRKSAKAIGSRASKDMARLTISASSRAPFALVAFYGTLRRTGFFNRRRFRSVAARQHPPWVRADWTIATAGEGPYVINEVLADRQDDIADLFRTAQLAAIARAVPANPR